MEQELYESLKKELMEDFNAPYDSVEDENLPNIGDERRPVITLRKLNRLKKMRNERREAVAQESALIPFLYGPPENSEDEDIGGMNMGGGLGL